MKKAFIGVVAAIALMGCFSVYSAYGTIETSTVTVTGKDRVVGKEDSKWIVMTDVVSLENTDSFLHLKFNSTDLQGQLEEGKMYNVTYYGYRVPFMSMYPNIINVEETQ